MLLLSVLLITVLVVKIGINNSTLYATLHTTKKDTDSFRGINSNTKGLTYSTGLACIKNEEGEYEMVTQKKNCGIGLILS